MRARRLARCVAAWRRALMSEAYQAGRWRPGDMPAGRRGPRLQPRAGGYRPRHRRRSCSTSTLRWDIGVAALAERSARRARLSPLVLGNVQPPGLDLNREEDSPALIPMRATATPFPATLLMPTEREARLERFFRPYHSALARAGRQAPPALILSLHSFTPSSRPRRARAGRGRSACSTTRTIAPRGSRSRCSEAEASSPGDNEPYSGKLLNATMNRHAEADGRPYLGIEIRQDLIGDGPVRRAGPTFWQVVARDCRNELAQSAFAPSRR